MLVSKKILNLSSELDSTHNKLIEIERRALNLARAKRNLETELADTSNSVLSAVGPYSSLGKNETERKQNANGILSSNKRVQQLRSALEVASDQYADNETEKAILARRISILKVQINATSVILSMIGDTNFDESLF